MAVSGFLKVGRHQCQCPSKQSRTSITQSLSLTTPKCFSTNQPARRFSFKPKWPSSMSIEASSVRTKWPLRSTACLKCFARMTAHTLPKHRTVKFSNLPFLFHSNSLRTPLYSQGNFKIRLFAAVPTKCPVRLGKRSRKKCLLDASPCKWIVCSTFEQQPLQSWD